MIIAGHNCLISKQLYVYRDGLFSQKKGQRQWTMLFTMAHRKYIWALLKMLLIAIFKIGYIYYSYRYFYDETIFFLKKKHWT